MDIDAYAALAYATAAAPKDREHALTIAALGLTGEAGELADALKKHIAQGHELDLAKLIDEAGDILWYLAYFAVAAETTLSEIATRNLDKLRKRYGDRFNPERSIHR
jgi:NTP pyrophosphatase (non-canonical NTP hydrolase)